MKIGTVNIEKKESIVLIPEDEGETILLRKLGGVECVSFKVHATMNILDKTYQNLGILSVNTNPQPKKMDDGKEQETTT